MFSSDHDVCDERQMEVVRVGGGGGGVWGGGAALHALKHSHGQIILTKRFTLNRTISEHVSSTGR